MTEILRSETLNIDKFMGRGSHCKEIPPYQRSYAWKRQQVVELLTDVKLAMDRQVSNYFIGSLLCVERKDDDGIVQEIVDGQQRLTTLSLIFAAAQHIVQRMDSQQLQELGVSKHDFGASMRHFLYIEGELFADSSTAEQLRLTVNLFDRKSFSQIIKNGIDAQSNRLGILAKAYREIEEFLNSNIKESGASFIKHFLSFLTQKVLLVNIKITEEADAYEIFEILNARNLQLAPVDLIKNKLFSFFGDSLSKNDEVFEKWKIAYTACNKRPQRMQEYVRCHLQGDKGIKIDPKNLYRELREILEEPESKEEKRKKAKGLLTNLDDHCHKFSALGNENDGFWDDCFDPKIKPLIGYLKKYRVANTIMFSMLYANLNPNFVLGAYSLLCSFLKRTRAVQDRLTVVVERYEEGFSALANKFYSGRYKKITLHAFFDELNQMDELKIIPDKSFLNQFANRSSIKDTSAKEILVELANHLQRKKQQSTLIDLATISLEHIFPKRPASKRDWPEFNDKETSSIYCERLGNLTLLNRNRNSSASNKKFSEKKKYYFPDKCAIALTNQLCEFDQWTPTTIQQRQMQLAKLAAEAWNFDSVKASGKT